jgi:putative DNA primase/helicase
MGKVLGGGFGKGPRKPATAARRVRVSKPLAPTHLKPKQPSAVPIPAALRLGLTDLDSADRFARYWKGKAKFAPGVGWLKWEGSHWEVLSDAEALHLCRKPAGQMADRFPNIALDDASKFAKWVTESRQVPLLKRTLTLAEGMSELRCEADGLDANPYLLATPSGVVDLKTGELIDPEPGQWMTHRTAVEYDPQAKAPKWEAYLAERLKGHLEVVGYVQRALGQGLIGYTGPHVFLLYGPTHCGKTTTLEVVMALLGGYAATMPVGVLMTNERGSEGAQPFLASLRGVRFVKASESKATDRFEAHVLKLLTGSDRIEVRHLYQRPFSMMPRFTVFLCTNHAPAVDDPGAAMWNRLRLIPFETSHTGHDETYIRRMVEEEGPGILRWLVGGARLAISKGFKQPLLVQTRTGEYRKVNDPLLEWLEVRCTKKEGVIGTGLRRDYVVWCRQAEYHPIGDKAWSEAMRQRFNISPARTSQGIAFIGVKLKSPTPEGKGKTQK